MSLKGKAIRDYVTRETITIHSSQTKDFIIGTPTNSLLNIKVRLVGQSKSCFRYSIGIRLIVVILVVRVATSCRGELSQDC